MKEQMRGVAAVAERLPLPPPDELLPAQVATQAGWLITAPGQAAGWSQYLLAMIHLRAIPGVPPAHIRVPGATHELILCALDPSRKPTPGDPDSFWPLMPLNVEAQVALLTDEQAVLLGELVAQAICDGVLPAEPAFPEDGRRLYQEVAEQTSEHLRTGRHG